MVPGRRGYGTKGKPITLRTNNFTLLTAYEAEVPEAERTWFKYDVTVTPELNKPKRRRLFEMITSDAKFRDMAWATDYANIIVTTKELELGAGGWTQKVVLPPAGGDAQNNQQGPLPGFVQEAQARNRVEFRVQSQGTWSPRHLIDHLRSSSANGILPTQTELIQLFNIIMCKPPNVMRDVVGVGQNKYYPHETHPGTEKYDLGGGLQAMRGYYSSVRPAVNRLLVNLNVTSGTFFKPGPLSFLLRETRAGNEQCEAFIRMLRVEVAYKRDNESEPHMKKIKTIVGFAKGKHVKRFGNANEVKFRYTDSNMATPQEREMTVFEYFRTVRGITLAHPNSPVLNVGTRDDPQYLPVELCTVLPGQSYRRLLSGDQTSEMLKFAARYPNLNAMSIAGTSTNPGNGLKLFRLDGQANSVKPFGFSVGVDMLTVPGRVHSSPQVKYAAKTMQPSGGAWNLARQRFVQPARFTKWQVLVINRQVPRGDAPEALFQNLGSTFHEYGLQMGIRAPTQQITLDPLIPQNRDQNNKQLDQAFGRADKEGVRILLVILPDVDRWLYARIKYYGDVAYGIHTVNSVRSKLQKDSGQAMYMANLALKFNIKGGGVCHTIPNVLKKPLDSNTMLMGIDVTHPSPGSSEGAPSIASVVASVDEHLSQWPGSVRTQAGRQEMVAGLAEMVGERLTLYQRKNKRFPSKIILYRDGVSEGQYDMVLIEEQNGIHEAFKKYYGAEKNWPKLAIIVVGKRHQTRFYPTREEDADYNAERNRGSWNPLPGTVVDRHISGPIVREFWLQAHQGLQGTARPAHYVVLKDDIVFEADELETFTHNMCYLFNRATKAVSICPPAYYADLLCERGRAYLFSTLAENPAADIIAFSGDTAEWTRDVHPRLAESTWYI